MIFDRKERKLLRKLSKKDVPGTHELRSIQFDDEKIVCASEDHYIKVGAILRRIIVTIYETTKFCFKFKRIWYFRNQNLLCKY